MKITITYKTSVQISPEGFDVYTKVIHCNEFDTLLQLHSKLTKDWSGKNFDGEIHFDVGSNTEGFKTV